MKKITIFFAAAAIFLSGCSLLGNKDVLKPEEAKEVVEKFINENIVAPGNEVTIKEISEDYGLYKLIVGFGQEQESVSYMTKDGKLLFPQVFNVAEIEQQLQQQAIDDSSGTDLTDNQSQVVIEIIQEGTGEREAQSGDIMGVNYKGILVDGTEFDSNLNPSQPFKFTIGQGQVIQGWEQGLIGMKVGEKRKLTIPPEFGYGSSGSGSVIPPNATLIFEVELISIE